jgi:hypothetical protein
MKIAFYVCLFISVSVFGQKNFLPGYIITLNGDTVVGKIDYRNWSFNPSKITFADSAGPIQVFSPLEIHGFFVANDLYKSAVVDKEMSAFLKGYAASSSELVLRKDTTFLRALTSSKGKNIYHFKTPENIDQFYIPKGNQYELLIYKKYKMTNSKGVQGEIENKRYIGQLVLYLNGCESIQSKLKSVTYAAKSFENVMLYYQRCLNPEARQLESNLRIRTDVGILTGLTSTMLKFKGDQSLMQHYLSQANWSGSVNFSFGGYLNFILPRNQGRFVLVNELFATSCSIKGEFLEQGTFQNYTKVNSSFRMNYVKLNDLFRYRFPINGPWGFLNIGISQGNAFNITNKQHIHSEFMGQIRDQDKAAIDGFRTYEFGFLAGIGFQFKRLTGEARYERANGFSEIATLGSVTSRMHILLSLKLNK